MVSSTHIILSPYLFSLSLLSGYLTLLNLKAELFVLKFSHLVMFMVFQPLLYEKYKFHDTCGVNNLHGMPGVLAGIIGAIVVSLADVDAYGYRYILVVSRSLVAECITLHTVTM